MHPGASGEDPEETGEGRITSALRAVGRCPRGVTLLLENTAGQGTSIGRTMEQLRRLIDASGAPPDIAVCLDSAHLFEAGYDIAGEEGWERLLEEIARHGILPLVRMWHLNDSKTDLGSRVDRHFHIGEGKIGLPGFRRIVKCEMSQLEEGKILALTRMHDDYHDMNLAILLDGSYRIEEIGGKMDRIPYPCCEEKPLAMLSNLNGISVLERGGLKKVKERIPRNAGCSHVYEMIESTFRAIFVGSDSIVDRNWNGVLFPGLGGHR